MFWRWDQATFKVLCGQPYSIEGWLGRASAPLTAEIDERYVPHGVVKTYAPRPIERPPRFLYRFSTIADCWDWNAGPLGIPLGPFTKKIEYSVAFPVGDYLLNDVAPRLQRGGTDGPYRHEGLIQAIENLPLAIPAVADIGVVNGILESLDDNASAAENNAIEVDVAFPTQILLRTSVPRYTGALALSRRVVNAFAQLADTFARAVDALDGPPTFEELETDDANNEDRS